MNNILKQNYLPAFIVSLVYGVLILASKILLSFDYSMISYVLSIVIPSLFLVLIPAFFFSKMCGNSLFSLKVIPIAFYMFIYAFILSVFYIIIHSSFFSVGDFDILNIISIEVAKEYLTKYTFTTILIFSLFASLTSYFISVFLNAVYYKVVIGFCFWESFCRSVMFSLYNFFKFFTVIFSIMALATLVELALSNFLVNEYVALFLINSVQVFLISLIFIYVSFINMKIIQKKAA